MPTAATRGAGRAEPGPASASGGIPAASCRADAPSFPPRGNRVGPCFDGRGGAHRAGNIAVESDASTFKFASAPLPRAPSPRSTGGMPFRPAPPYTSPQTKDQGPRTSPTLSTPTFHFFSFTAPAGARPFPFSFSSGTDRSLRTPPRRSVPPFRSFGSQNIEPINGNVLDSFATHARTRIRAALGRGTPPRGVRIRA